MAVTTTYSFVNVSPEFGVNSTTAGSQTAPALTRTQDGNLLFAFQSDEAVLPNQNVLGRIVSPAGVPAGNDFTIQAGPNDLETAPQLATLSNGTVVAIYTDSSASNSGGGTSTAFRIFTGTSGSFPTIFENESDDQTAPAIAALGSGFVIAHLDQFVGSPTANSLSVQRFNADGTTNGGQINVADSVNDSPFRAPAIASLSDGGFVVVWTADVTAGAGENYDVFAQRYTAAGATNGAQITINAETDNQANPTVVGLVGGGFAVAWEDEENGSTVNGNIDFTTVDTSGTVGSISSITFSGRQEAPSAAAFGSDLFVVTYASDTAGTQDILATVANSQGPLATTSLDASAGSQTDPAEIMLSNGQFTTAWTDASGDGSGTRISARTDRVGRTSISDGSSDTIIGDDLQDTVDGGNGIDTIDGGGGDDLLQGGLSGDSITGGFGNDMLYGMTAADPGGSAVGDTLDGGSGDDTIVGSGGADRLTGNNGDDLISGGLGSDLLEGGLNADTLLGGGGNDTIFANTMASPSGSSVGDVMAGEDGNDTIVGSSGDDAIAGGAGSDSIDGGAGFDYARYDLAAAGIVARLDTGAGTAGEATGDTFVNIEGLFGSAFGDVLFGDLYGNSLFGLAGNDTLVGNAGWDTIDGGDNADLIIGDLADGSGDGYDQLTGGAGNDTIYGCGGGDSIFAGADADTVFGNDGNDVVNGDAGADTLYGNLGADQLYGGADNDVIIGDNEGGGGNGNDYVVGQAGNDTLYGCAGDDTLVGDEAGGSGTGNDALYGNEGIDILYGCGGNDYLVGGDGLDVIYGGDGADTLIGDNEGGSGLGNDVLSGGLGIDVIYTGAGNDTVQLDVAPGMANYDVVYDFVSGTDHVALSSSIYGAANTGSGGVRFVTGPQAVATTNAATVIYDTFYHALLYDADGNGAGAAQLMATLPNTVTMTAADLFFI